MSMTSTVVDALLALVVLSCWVGAAGMLRMRTPLQSLHYLAIPATVGISAAVIAVLLESGLNANTAKVLVIAVVLLAFNAVVTHASARAFRTRELGHWEPRDGDPIEFVSFDRAPGTGDRSLPRTGEKKP